MLEYSARTLIALSTETGNGQHYNSCWSDDQQPVMHQCNQTKTQLLRHLRHFEAFLGTVATSLGTSGHFLVIRDRLAGSGAIVTALCTAQRGMGREIALPSAQC